MRTTRRCMNLVCFWKRLTGTVPPLCRAMLVCLYCSNKISRGDPCSIMKRGEFGGMSLHPLCARLWYIDHPLVDSAPPPLMFYRPPPELKTFLDEFINGDFLRAHIDNTAGGGKTNSIVYMVSKIRERRQTVIVAMLGKEAKQEMFRRGLSTFEVNNFHAITDRAYKVLAMLVRHRCPWQCLHSLSLLCCVS